MNVTVYGTLKIFAGKQFIGFFFLVLMNKKCVKKCISSPVITVGVGKCEFRYNIVNFHKKRSVPKEIPSEVEVSVIKMIVIMRDDCNGFHPVA